MGYYDWLFIFVFCLMASRLKGSSAAVWVVSTFTLFLVFGFVSFLLVNTSNPPKGLFTSLTSNKNNKSSQLLYQNNLPIKKSKPLRVPNNLKIQKSLKSTITVYANGCRYAKAGTAWPYKKGEALTAAHVVAGANRIQITYDGRTYESYVTKISRENDLAAIYIPKNIKPFVRSQFEFGWAVGYPDGSDNYVTKSSPLSTAWIDIVDIDKNNQHRKSILGSTKVYPGMSGGPVLNKNGEVMGTIRASLNKDYFVATPNLYIGTMKPKTKTTNRCP